VSGVLIMGKLQHRGEYGFDGNLSATVAVTGVAIAALGVAIALASTGHVAVALPLGALALLWFSTLGIALHTTRRGKFLVWNEVLDALQLRGDEQVLDVGCGRGAVLTMVAGRLPRGRVTGLDIWSRADQSGNAIDVTKRNLELEGVAGRCELKTGDMREMPFEGATFDVVVSSLAIHNIVDPAGRARALEEIARVLKPGGRFAIADLAWTDAYAEKLIALGLRDVRRSRLGWRFWWGPAFPATSLVTGTKHVPG
jgi:SAM-dependent methyltransferase